MLSPPTRLESDIYEAAKLHGATASRSAAQQLAHWARIGRQLELARSTGWREIVEVLEGDADYDDLPERDQAIVRSVWAERIDVLAAEVDLTATFAAQGRSRASAADADGTVVTIELDGGKPKKKAAKRK